MQVQERYSKVPRTKFKDRMNAKTRKEEMLRNSHRADLTLALHSQLDAEELNHSILTA